MANALYDGGRNAFLSGAIDWVNDDIRVVLVDTATYAVDLAANTNLSAIPAGERIQEIALAGKTAVAGVADANDVTFAAVTGDQAEALVIYKFDATDNELNSVLIAYIDTATGLPVTPNTGDIIVQWSGGVNKIFKL